MQQAAKHLPKEFIPVTSSIRRIECSKAWSQLASREQLYAYYLSRAAWEGSKICYFQRSYEAPALFVLLQLVFSSKLESLKVRVLGAGLLEQQWRQMLAYSAAVFQNCGNYKSFGDTKFVPELDAEAFKTIVRASENYEMHKEVMDSILEQIEREVFTEDEPFARIGFRDENNGTTSYYSSGVTSAEAKMVDEWCQSLSISPLNTRLFKLTATEYELRIASQLSDPSATPYLKTYEKGGKKLHVRGADFADVMSTVVAALRKAKEHAGNDNQRNMAQAYVEHFRYGDVDQHKESQRHWIKDVGPVVESNIGFIETYLDPLGARAEFEGFVAVVDKETSAQFNTLVEEAEGLIEKLPWAKDFEKAKFSKPDFTNLDIVAFACSGTPIGINIPNYDDIRMDFGFKNVNLGNAYPVPTAATTQFLSQSDVDLNCRYTKESLTLIVALHELLGHGTGKLLTKDVETGELNFPQDLKNPFTGEEIKTYYLSTETWSQKFGKLHSGYEECRADSVALFLMQYDEPFHIFFPDRQSEWDDIHYAGWLGILTSSVKGLQYYNPEVKVWGQAHVLASWAILQAVREGDPSVIQIEFCEKDGRDFFFLHVDRSKLRTTAFKALSEFLCKLHTYKAMGDFDAAKAFFDHYSQVDDEMLRVRDIVLAWKLPRGLELQPNLFLDHATHEVVYKDYEDSFEGVIRSHVERFPDSFQADVWGEWVKDAKALRYD